jgi:putative transposase
MPRDRRLDIPGAIHHVIVRGIERRRIFNNDQDYQSFISRLETSLTRTQASCYAWAILPNHLHLLIRTGKFSLGHTMRPVLTGYAIYFNKKNKRHGYLYQNRYKSILCQEDTYFLKLVAYIHLNPLRAKLVNSVNDLSTYKWSGHPAIIGKAECKWLDADYVLSQFDTKLSTARAKYLEFIKDQHAIGPDTDLSSGGLKKSLGGWEGVEEAKRNKDYWRGDERLLGDSSFVDEVLKISEEAVTRKEKLLKAGWDLEKVIDHICKKYSIDKSDIMLKGRQDNKAKAKAVISYIAHRDLGISGTEIAKRLNISNVAVSKNVRIGSAIIEEDGMGLSL